MFFPQRATNKLQQQILSHYHKTAHKDHRAILQRKVIIEHRKERLEHINLEKVGHYKPCYCLYCVVTCILTCSKCYFIHTSKCRHYLICINVCLYKISPLFIFNTYCSWLYNSGDFSQEMKEQLAIQKQEQAMKVAEQQRLHKEQQEREEKRKKEREKEEKRKNVTDRLEMMRKTDIGQKMLGDIDIQVTSLSSLQNCYSDPQLCLSVGKTEYL